MGHAQPGVESLTVKRTEDWPQAPTATRPGRSSHRRNGGSSGVEMLVSELLARCGATKSSEHVKIQHLRVEDARN